MHIKKIGHCCLVIDTKDKRIVTDPGSFTREIHGNIDDVDIVLITHEHADHLHIESLKILLEKNPDAQVITNSSVGKLLREAGVEYEILEGKDVKEVLGISLEAIDQKHEEMFEDFGQVQNTGYFVDNTLLYPGDAYAEIGKAVEVLALPVAGPWCKVPDAIRYALKIQPKKVFPVHDGQLEKERIGGSHGVPKTILSEQGIEFIPLCPGDEVEV